MHFTRRLIAWAFYLGFLAAVSVVVFAFVRSQPRCTISCPFIHMYLSADGSRLATLKPKQNCVYNGPLQVWDTQSGHVVHEWFHDAEVLPREHSPDGRHAAVVLDDGVLRIVDVYTGKSWRFDEPPKDDAVNRADFSPGGRWLQVVTARCDTLYVIDVHTCQVVLRMRDNWPIISADDKLIYYREGKDRKITVWDIQEAKALSVVSVTAQSFALSADGRLLLELPSEPIPAPPEEPGDGPFRGIGVRKIERKDYRVAVWDVATGTRRFQHEMARRGDLQTMLSPDNRFLAVWLREDNEPSPLQMLDAVSGKVLWSHPMKRGYTFEFSHDGSVCFLVRRLEDHPLKRNYHLTMFDSASGQVLWERPAGGNTYFARNENILLHQGEFDEPLQFLDARTGIQQATVPLNFPTANYIPMQTPDGRFFVIGGWQVRHREPYFWEKWLEKRWPLLFGEGLEGAMVMETATGRELFRVLGRARSRTSCPPTAARWSRSIPWMRRPRQ